MRKKIISTFLVVTMLLSFMTTAAFSENAKISFTDVDATTEEGAAIYKLAEHGIVSGHGDGTFAPQNNVTRAELCKMVNLIWNLTEPATEGFSDVTEDKWYYNHVLIAKKAGYIKGFDDGTFKGENNVTREQACAMVCRISGLNDAEFTETISDPVSDWAKADVKKILGNGLMVLEPGNTFKATENMKRGELAKVFANFISEESGDKSTTEKEPVTENNQASQTPGNTSTNNSSTNNSAGGPSSSTPSSGPTGGSPSGSDTQKPTVDYTKDNASVVANLTAAKTDLMDNRELFTEPEKEIIDIVIDVLDDLIGNQSEYLITSETVYMEYTGEIFDALEKYSELDERSRNAFVSKVSRLNTETFNFLTDFFGVDISDIDSLLQ